MRHLSRTRIGTGKLKIEAHRAIVCKVITICDVTQRLNGSHSYIKQRWELEEIHS